MSTVIARLNVAKAVAKANLTRRLNQLRIKTLPRTDGTNTSRMALSSAGVVTQAARLRSHLNLPGWTALATLLLCIAYYVAAQIGLTLHFPMSLVYFVWPPSVVVFVALILSPRRIWWVYALAVLPVHMLVEWTAVSAPLTSLALFYAVVWVQAIVGAVCVARFARRPIQLNTLRALIAFLFSGAVIAALAEALTLSIVLELTTSHPGYRLNFAQAFLADCLTMLVFAPALVSGYAFARQMWLASGAPINDQRVLTRTKRIVSDWFQTLSLARASEAVLLTLGLLGAGFFAFGGDVTLPGTLPALLYLVLPLLLWAAVRFGLGGTSLALCGLMLLSIMYAIQGRGPFSTLTTTADLFSLQVFFIAISVPLLTLAVLMRERQQAQEELEQSEARYRAVVSNFPNGAVLLFDAQLRHVFADGQGVHSDSMFERAVVGSTVWDAFPAPLAARLAPQYQAALAGTLSTFDLVADHRTYYVQTLPVHQNQVTAGMAVMQEITEQRQAEALAEQERLFRTLVENSPDIITRFDRNLRHLYVSPGAEEVIGIPAAARLGKTYAEIGYPEGVYSQWEGFLRAAFATGQPQVFESDFRTTAGPRRVSQIRYIPERGADGSVESVLGITSDITQLKRTEEALRQSEERFSKAFHASPVAMAITSPTTSRILDANAAVVQLTGYRQDELLGRTARELGLIALIDTQQASLPTRWPKGARDVPVRVRMKSGEIRSCLVSTEGIWAGGEECTIVITHDVTAREQAEAALAEQEQLFRTLVENSPDIIARFDRNLRYLYVNPAIAAVGALPADAYIGKTNAELGWPDSLAAPAHRAIEEVFRTGESCMLDESDPATADTQDGRVFRAQLLPEFASDGTVESVLSVTTEITDMKRAESALRAATASAEIARHDEEQRRYEAERRERIAASLHDVLAILNSNQQVATILEYIARKASDLLSSDAAAIYTTDTHGVQGMGSGTRMTPAANSSEALALRAAFGHPAIRPSTRGERRLAAGRAAIRKAMAARRPVAVFASSAVSHGSRRVDQERDVQSRAERPEQTTDAPGAIADWIVIHNQSLPSPYRALLAVPIVAQGQVYGGLLLLYSAPHSFSPDEVSLAMAYSDQIALAIANARLQSHLEWAATQAERTRLARELHDTVTQEIFTASMLAESIPLVWERRPTEAEAGLRQLHQLTRGALASLRALLLELRPAVLEQKSLSDLLRQLGEAMTTRAGVPILVTISDEHLQLPNVVKVAFYRIAQEALMNTVKYAHPRNISVRLRAPAEGAIQLEIQDDGQGFEVSDVPAGHFGVTMMRERARAVGATLRLTSRRDRGTRVAVKWTENASAAPAHHGDAALRRALRGVPL